MSKKKATSKKTPPVKKVSVSSKSVPAKNKPKSSLVKKVASVKKVSSTVKPKTKVAAVGLVKKKKKYIGKKRGRKPSTFNRYNDIKSAISKNYLEIINRKVKRYELKIIYDWIKNTYGTQSIRYVLMNIDLILDNFWQQYCNLYPIDLNNHARFFEWYNFKNFLFTEKKFHYPTDIIQVDLTTVGLGVFEFFFEDYTSKCEEYYEMLKSEGIKRESPPPALYLVDAICDIQRKGNLYKYQLLMDSEIPKVSGGVPVGGGSNVGVGLGANGNVNSGSNVGGGSNVNSGSNVGSLPSNTKKPIDTPNNTTSGISVAKNDANEVSGGNNGGNGGGNVNGGGNNGSGGLSEAARQQIEIEVQKERIKAEVTIKEAKLRELRELLKDKVITFKEYMDAVKDV